MDNTVIQQRRTPQEGYVVTNTSTSSGGDTEANIQETQSRQPQQELHKSQMTDDHKLKLTKNRVVIVQTVRHMTDIVDHLLGAHCINDETAQTILLEQTSQAQARQLLTVLQTRSEAAFNVFLEALVETQETPELYQLLKDESMPVIPQRRSGPPMHGPARHYYEKLQDFHKVKLDRLASHPDQGGHDLTTHIQLTLYDKQSSDVEIQNRHGFRELSMAKSRGTPIQPEDLYAKLQDDSEPRTVLMVGAPGVGKTATCFFLLQQFLNLRLWRSTFQFVIFIILRELSHFRTKLSFKDLIFNCFGPSLDDKSTQDHVWIYLQSHQKDILLILDGMDEISGLGINSDKHLKVPIHDPEFRTQPQTLIHNLIEGNFLKHSRILVSARPHIAGILKRSVHRTVELLGLTFDDFGALTKKVLVKSPNLAIDFIKYIDNSPEIMNLCTSPINARGLLNHIKESHSEGDQELQQDCLPTSKAALLYFLTLNLLRNHDQALQRDPRLTHRDIVCQRNTLIRKLADMAYSSLFSQQENQQQLFDEEDLGYHDLDIQVVVTSGLMSAHLSWLKDGFWGVQKFFFGFPHLTIQEFLGALKLALAPMTELENIIQEQGGERDVILALCVGAMTDPTCQELLTALYPAIPIHIYRDKALHMLRAIWSAPRNLKKDGPLYSINVLCESGMYDIADELSHNLTTLYKCLNLVDANVSPANCRSIDKLLQHQSEPLYEVVLVGRIDRESITRIMRGGSCRGLSLATEFTSNVLQHIGQALDDSQHLHQLTLNNTSDQLDWSGFRVTDNASLQCLRLYGALDTSHMEALCDTLASLHSLKALHLWSGTLSPLTLPHLPAGLRYLALAACGLVGQDITVLADTVLASQLVWLDINRNKISDEGAATLAQCLQDTNNVLEGLRLIGCQISSKGVGVICEAIECNKHLKLLSLTENSIGDDFDPIISVLSNSVIEELYVEGCGISSAGGCEIVNSLTHNTRLTFLNLGCNTLGSKEFGTCLRGALKGNKHLLGLVIYDRDLTDETLDLIASGLKHNPTLQLLAISNNPSLTSSSIVRLLADTKLQHLSMDGCKLGVVGWGKVGRALTHSSTLVSCLVGDKGKAGDLEGFVKEMSAYHHAGPLQRLFLRADSMEEVASLVHVLRQTASYTVSATGDGWSLYVSSGLFWQHVPPQIRLWLSALYLHTR